MKEIESIEKLIKFLPKSDVRIGHRLLEKREFSELQLLVDSVMVKIKHNLSLATPKEEYKSIHLEKLEKLSMIISNYRDQLVENYQQEREEYNDELEFYSDDYLEDEM